MHISTLFKTSLALALLAGAGISHSATVVITQVEDFADLGGNNYNLTTLGTNDWNIFGGSTVAPTEEMNGGSGIGALSYNAGAGVPGLIGEASGRTPNFNWTNGSPTASSTGFNPTSLSTQSDTSANVGQTFTLTVDATTLSSSLYLWLVAENSFMDLSASITGASDTLAIGTGSNNLDAGLFRIDFTADLTETMTVSIAKTSTSSGTRSRFGIEAAALTVIPEPSTAALLGAGVAGIAFLHRRRRQQR